MYGYFQQACRFLRRATQATQAPPRYRMVRRVEDALEEGDFNANEWGFYLCRTHYGDDDLWRRYLDYIAKHAQEVVEGQRANGHIRRNFRIVSMEGDAMDGKSPDECRRVYADWRDGNIPFDDDEGCPVGPGARSELLLDYPLLADKECLESLREHEELEPGYLELGPRKVFVKALNAERTNPSRRKVKTTVKLDAAAGRLARQPDVFIVESEKDEGERAAEEQDDPDFKVMKVSCAELVHFWTTMSSKWLWEWERQWRAFRYPEMRPWEDTCLSA